MVFCYCIICWCIILLWAAWVVAQEKLKGNDVNLWAEFPGRPLFPNMAMILLAPFTVPILIFFGIGWLIDRTPHVIAAGFADIQEWIYKRKKRFHKKLTGRTFEEEK